MSEEKMKKSFKLNKLDIIGLVLFVVFIPIIAINLTLVIKGFINPDKVPMVFNHAPLIVISDSMTINKENGTGAFNKNDLIIIKKVDPSSLKEDDIITYIATDGAIVTHRINDLITDKDGNPAFETIGDYTHAIDPYPITYDQVVGKYLFRLPNAGGIAMFLQKPAGIVVVLFIPVFIILGIDFLKKSKEQKSSESKNAELEAEIARLRALQEQQSSEKTEDESVNS